jgi:hypothetical protein
MTPGIEAADHAAPEAGDVEALLARAPLEGADRLDLLIGLGRWALRLDPAGDRLPADTLAAARRSVGRPIDAADTLPDLRGPAEHLPDELEHAEPEDRAHRAWLRLDERTDLGCALRGLEVLWPERTDALHRYVRRRRGLTAYDLALSRLDPGRYDEEVLQGPRELNRVAGLRRTLFGPLVDMVAIWSPLHWALWKGEPSSPLAWHALAVRILELDAEREADERTLNDAVLDLLRLIAVGPSLAEELVTGRWRSLLRLPAAELGPASPMSLVFDRRRILTGGEVLKRVGLARRRTSIGERALGLAARLERLERLEWARGAAHRRVAFRQPARPLGVATRLVAGAGSGGPLPLVLMSGSVQLSLTETRSGQVRATVEEDGHGVAGALVAWVPGGADPAERTGIGVTDASGEILLGPTETLLPLLASGWTLEVVPLA